MICWSNFPTCLATLFNCLSKKEIALFILVNDVNKGSYGLFRYGESDLDWSEMANGNWRVVLCMTPSEVWEFLLTPLIPYFPEVDDADSTSAVEKSDDLP